MAISNIERVGKGLELLRAGLASYIQRELKGFFKERWWLSGVESLLDGTIGREGLSTSGTDEERFSRLDAQALLVIMWENWNNIFREQLGYTGRSYVSELREVRIAGHTSNRLMLRMPTAPSIP